MNLKIRPIRRVALCTKPTASHGTNLVSCDVLLSMLCAILWCATAGADTLATDVTTPVSSNPRPTAGLEEIVVTATKRAESLQDVPLAITAVTGATLTALGAVDFTDYARTVPGLSFTDLGSGRQIVALRGLNPSSGAATVSFYIDETPIPAAVGNLSRVQSNPDLVDVDRIEVLRGPQGTLYGSSSMGGTIRLIPKAPDLKDLGGWIDVGGTRTQGDAWGRNVTGVLNAPIVSDVFGARLAAWYRDDDGFITRKWGPNTPVDPTSFQGTQNHVGSETLKGGRLSLLFAPSDSLNVSGLLYHDERTANGFQDYTAGVSNPSNSFTQVELANVPEPSSTQFTLSNITAKLTLGNIKLTSSSSYYESKLSVTEEGTAFLQSIFGFVYANADTETHKDKNYTQEFRLATVEPFHGVSVIAGVYYNRDADQDVYNNPIPGWNAIYAPTGPTDPSGLYALNNELLFGPFRGDAKEVSEFGELSYAVTDKLKVTGGVRHFDINNSGSGYYDGLATVNQEISQNTAGEYKGSLYKGNVSYQITGEHMVYATYSEGFRPGFGIAPLPSVCDASLAQAGFSSPPTQVNPDSVKNYEVGAKTEWLNRRLGINLSVYAIDWKDIQQQLFLSCGQFVFANAGRAKSRGVELEVPAQITDRLGAGVSGSYTKATLSDNQPSFGALAGDQINNVPRWQTAVHVDYSFPMAASMQGVMRLDTQYTGSSYAAYNRLAGTTERDPMYLLQGLLLVNSRFEVTKGDWSAALFGDNLLDRESREGSQNSLIANIAGRPRYVPNRPRTFGVNFRKKF